jgi:ADP-ribose pyrophosphatase YjhB (NUDIX family)
MIKIINKTRLLAVNQGRILVMQKKTDQLLYTLPGGIKKKKERLVKSLKRETKEEIGLKVKIKKLSFLSTQSVQKELQLLVKHYFVFKTKTNDFRVLEPEKFVKVLWIPWREAFPFLDKEDKKAVKMYFKKSKTLTKLL